MGDTSSIADALPDYEVSEELGRGAMGIVYRGRHRQLGRMVAIKELPQAFATDPTVRARFEAEARVLAALDHPHVVIVHDFVDRDGMCLLVMEELPGGTLWERFVGQGMTGPAACAMTIAACSGLAHAHERGVLHRDVKPENLMFGSDGQVKVTDFGIAKVLNGAQQLATVDGSVLGTPAYMAPEQAHGDPVGPAADVYAAASMLYELLSGRLPYADADGPMAMLVRRISEDPPHLSAVAPGVPAPVADAVMKGLRRDPDRRTPDPETFACEIGVAAATAWGVDWLDSTGITVKGSERVDHAVRTTLDPKGTSATASAAAPVSADPAARSAETIMPGTAPAEDAPASDQHEAAVDDSPAEPAAPPDEPAAAVKPSVTSHDRGADLNRVDPRKLISVSDLIAPPRHGPLLIVAGLAVVVVAILIAVAGIGGADLTGDLDAGTVALGGADPTSDEILELDLSEPVAVTAPASFSEAKLSFSVLGLPLGNATVDLVNGAGELDPEMLKWTVGGAVTGKVELVDASGSGPSVEFAAEATQPWYATAPGIAGIVLVLAAIAYVQSNLRPLRQGRPFRVGPMIALEISGALIGVAAVVLAGALAMAEPTVTGLIVAAVVAGIGTMVLGEGVRRSARAARVKRRRKALGG